MKEGEGAADVQETAARRGFREERLGDVWAVRSHLPCKAFDEKGSGYFKNTRVFLKGIVSTQEFISFAGS